MKAMRFGVLKASLLRIPTVLSLRRSVLRARRELVVHARYVIYVIQGWLSRPGNIVRNPAKKSIGQAVLDWEVPWPEFRSHDELQNWLREMDIEYCDGRWTVYIPPQPNLHRVLGAIPDHYPHSAGYKILKNFRSPHDAQYCFRETADVEQQMLWRKRGNVFDNLKSANFLFVHDISPRCWDVTHWHASGQSYTVFVVDHVTGTPPSEAQGQVFVAALEQLSSGSLLKIVTKGRWQDRLDFRSPDFNRNLIVSAETGKLQYVDFQNFVVDSRLWTSELIAGQKAVFHFGRHNPLTRREFIYQSVPGCNIISKRDVRKRWKYISSELVRNDISICSRVVLDVGCNQGVMMYQALSEGALWAIGWDRPKVVEQAEKLLFSLGASRFNVIGAELDAEYSLLEGVPSHVLAHMNEAILLYLSMRKHIGMMRDLSTLPWRVLVYEGHRGEDVDCTKLLLEPLLGEHVELRSAALMSDGPGGVTRPVAILVRKKV